MLWVLIRITSQGCSLESPWGGDSNEHPQHRFLAHLSRRLIGELIGYSWSGVRPSGVRPSSFIMLKDLLRNRWANQSQILCGASLGRGNESLYVRPGSHDQDGRHAHMVKTLQKTSSSEPAGRFSRNLVCSIGDSSPS